MGLGYQNGPVEPAIYTSDLSHPEPRSVNFGPLVKRSYEQLDYSSLRSLDHADAHLGKIIDRIETGSPVLDIGCGTGQPVTEVLSRHFDVKGVDISSKQARHAKRNVPDATIREGNILNMDLPHDSFAAVTSYYTLFNIHREKHYDLLERIYESLFRGGLLLFDAGRGDCGFKMERDWLGTGVPMYWSYYSQEEYLRMLKDIGYTVISVEQGYHELKRDRERWHPFVLARK